MWPPANQSSTAQIQVGSHQCGFECSTEMICQKGAKLRKRNCIWNLPSWVQTWPAFVLPGVLRPPTTTSGHRHDKLLSHLNVRSCLCLFADYPQNDSCWLAAHLVLCTQGVLWWLCHPSPVQTQSIWVLLLGPHDAPILGGHRAAQQEHYLGLCFFLLKKGIPSHNIFHGRGKLDPFWSIGVASPYFGSYLSNYSFEILVYSCGVQIKQFEWNLC